MRLPRVLIFLIVFLPIAAMGQNGKIDSLKSILATSPEDSTKVDLLNSISTAVRGSSPEEAINFGTQGKELAENINYQTGLAYALKNIGLGYYKRGDYVETSIYWEESLEIFESLGDDLGSANLLSNLGVVLTDLGKDDKAINNYLRSLRLAEKLGDSLRIATVLGNIGFVYSLKEETYDQALNYYRLALPIGEKIGDLDIVGTTTSNIGDIFYQWKNYDSALFYLEKSLVVFENTIDAAVTLDLIGRVYTGKEEFQKAIEYHLEAIEIATKFDAKLDLAESYLGLARTYRLMGRTNDAIVAYQKAQSFADEIRADYTLKDVYEELALSFRDLSDFKNAYEYQIMFDAVKDSVYKIETNDKIKTMQLSYEMDKKVDEIEILEQTAEIEGLQIERQGTIILAGSATVVLLLVMGFILLNRYKYVQRTKKIIEIEKDKSQQLLLNILPEETARELEENGSATPRHYDSVSVLFTDFKSFTKLAESISPAELVEELDTYFKAFDDIIDKNGLEKIKTIGDAYMAAGGLNDEKNHATSTVKVAKEMLNYLDQKNKKSGIKWEMRVGIHCGTVVGGVIGSQMLSFDLWGDTVNIASRMEKSGKANKINISAYTYDLIKQDIPCEYRGKIETKDRGQLDMYFVK